MERALLCAAAILGNSMYVFEIKFFMGVPKCNSKTFLKKVGICVNNIFFFQKISKANAGF